METLINRTYGKVHIVAGIDYDEDMDMARDLGTFTSYRRETGKGPLYSRRDDTIRLPGSTLWRDRKGRIAAEPDDDRHSREYQFIELADWYGETLKVAFSVADRLEGLGKGDWSYVTIFARVYVNGREVGSSAVGGVESDAGDYLKECARQETHSAIAEARTWLASLAVQA